MIVPNWQPLAAGPVSIRMDVKTRKPAMTGNAEWLSPQLATSKAS